MKVGEIYKTKNWGDVEILEYNTCKFVTVKFVNTGNIGTFRSMEINKGNIRDKQALSDGVKPFINAQKRLGALDVGSVWDSNFSGKSKVLEYHGSRNVVIEFLNTGNKYKVQKDALIKGLVKDSKHDSDVKAESLRIVNLEAEEYRRLAQEKAEAVARKREDALQVEILRREYASKKRDDAMKQVVYNSPEFGNYSILNKLSNNCFEVVFEDTGGVSTYSLYNLTEGKVFDTARYTPEQLEARDKERRAGYYQKNRGRILEQAKLYQKLNPEKSRLRNRNRRARRMNADGTHTQADSDLILAEQGGKCCGCDYVLDDTKHLDHFVPLVSGGSNSADNLQWLCQFCNNSKSGKDPMTWLLQISTKAYQARRAAALEY